jgi:hypothetical protein
MTKDNKVSFMDSKEAIRSGEQMVKSFNEIRRIVGNFKDMSLLDAKKMFPSAFDSRVGELDKSLSVLKARMNEFN